MKERLLQFLNTNNLTATHLADKIGVQRSSVSHVLSGRNKPSYDFIHKILTKYDDLSADWLISGKGEMFLSKDKEHNMVQNVSERNEQQRDLFSNMPSENIKTETSSKQPEIKQHVPDRQTETVEPSDKQAKKELVKVILLYNDGSFQAYKPHPDD
jgi:transcriptional regulator with XRE-family HTH domain